MEAVYSHGDWRSFSRIKPGMVFSYQGRISLKLQDGDTVGIVDLENGSVTWGGVPHGNKEFQVYPGAFITV